MPSTPVATEARAAVLLELERFGVEFTTAEGPVTAARDISLSVRRGECLGVVGESGAGKSQVFLGALGLLAANGRAHGTARFAGADLLTLGRRELDAIRGRHIGLIFQDPMTSLTPHLTVGAQIIEVRRRHLQESAPAARSAALALLEQVQMSDPERRLSQYPYELSGGMRQRAMVALSLAAEPQLLICDEPTTALDVTLQAQILALLAALKRARGLALVLITHDLGAVAGLAERIGVLKDGRMVEEGTAAQVLLEPRERYTRALLAAAAPAQAAAAPPPVAAAAAAALSVENLSVEFPVRGGFLRRARRLRAVDGVSFSLARGDSLALVGESGCGKSTLARAALALLPASAGRVLWLGTQPTLLPEARLRAQRRDLQIIFQDPLASLDPRCTAGESIAEGLKVHEPRLDAEGRALAVLDALSAVGLAPELAARYPHELSGGQCQRVGIARAMVLRPAVLVCDEPLSALDLTTQAAIVALLEQLKEERALTLLFISHNLALVRRLCEQVLVLYLGRMMEAAPAEALFATPRHPYTRELLAAIPSTDPRVQPQRLLAVRPGEAASPLDPPSGCVYRSRCPFALPVCAAARPPWESAGPGHEVACHRFRELPPAVPL
jgi:oligopeptide/dipeptide ABC transporter ATP-binding protein